MLDWKNTEPKAYELGAEVAQRYVSWDEAIDAGAFKGLPDTTRAWWAAEAGFCDAQESNVEEERQYAVMCRREQAMEAGMAFGCEGYNDFIGWRE